MSDTHEVAPPVASVILRVVPVTGWVTISLMAITFPLSLYAGDLSSAASSWVGGTEHVLSAAIVLNELALAALNLAELGLTLAFVFGVTTLVQLRPKAIQRRFRKHSTFIAQQMASTALILTIMESEIRSRDEQLQLYDEMARLRDAGVEELVERFNQSTVLGIKTTWAVGLIFFFLSVSVSLLTAVILNNS